MGCLFPTRDHRLSRDALIKRARSRGPNGEARGNGFTFMHVCGWRRWPQYNEYVSLEILHNGITLIANWSIIKYLVEVLNIPATEQLLSATSDEKIEGLAWARGGTPWVSTRGRMETNS